MLDDVAPFGPVSKSGYPGDAPVVPVTTIDCPVTYPLSSLHRNAITGATSAGSPGRPSVFERAWAS